MTDALDGDLSHGSAYGAHRRLLRDEWTMRELATRYGVSRKTAYKWVGRYEQEAAGLLERSRAPRTHGRAMPAVRAAMLALRRQFPRWGVWRVAKS